MAAGRTVNLPPGFQLEGEQSTKLPEGFQLEQPQQPSAMDRLKNVFSETSNLMPGVLPARLAMQGLEKVNQAVEHGAYKAGGVVTDLLSGGQDEFGNKVPSEVPAAAGYVTNLGIQSLPVIASSAMSAESVAPKLKSMAERIMQSALKPSVKEMETGRGAAAIKTALEDGHFVSSGSADALRKTVGDLETKIQSALSTSGNTVDRGAVASRLQDLIARIERTSLNPQERVAAVEKVYNDVLSNPKLAQSIPVKQANEIKQGIYKMLSEKYGELGSDAVEAQKRLALGLKQEIAKVEPGVAADLQKQSALANLLKIMQRRANVEGGNNIGGLAPLAGNPVAAIGFLADKYGLTKSALARLLYSGQRAIPAVGGGTVGAAMAQRLGTEEQ